MVPSVDLQYPLVVLCEDPVRFAFPEYPRARSNKIVVEHPLVKRALPASPVDRVQALAAPLHALKTTAGLAAPLVEIVLQGSPPLLAVQALVLLLLGHTVVVLEIVLQKDRGPFCIPPAHACCAWWKPLYISISGGFGHSSGRMERASPVSLLVVIGCTLAGGIDRDTPPTENAGSCSKGSSFSECGVLDEGIAQEHVASPWGIVLATLAIMSLPALFLRCKHKERALRQVAWDLLQCLVFMLCSCATTDHPSMRYTLSVHSSALLIGKLGASSSLVWAVRVAGILCLLGWIVMLGPPISVVRWPSTPQGQALTCAYLAHLVAVIVPECVMCVLQWGQRLLDCA
jgi:hypothetical protein